MEDPLMRHCDECGLSVTAKVIVTLPSGRFIKYCNHCRDHHFEALIEHGAIIVPIG